MEPAETPTFWTWLKTKHFCVFILTQLYWRLVRESQLPKQEQKQSPHPAEHNRSPFRTGPGEGRAALRLCGEAARAQQVWVPSSGASRGVVMSHSWWALEGCSVRRFWAAHDLVRPLSRPTGMAVLAKWADRRQDTSSRLFFFRTLFSGKTLLEVDLFFLGSYISGYDFLFQVVFIYVISTPTTPRSRVAPSSSWASQGPLQFFIMALKKHYFSSMYLPYC